MKKRLTKGGLFDIITLALSENSKRKAILENDTEKVILYKKES